MTDPHAMQRALAAVERGVAGTIVVGEVVAASADGRRVDVELAATGLDTAGAIARGVLWGEAIVGHDQERAMAIGAALAASIAAAFTVTVNAELTATVQVNEATISQAIQTALTTTWGEAIAAGDVVDYVRPPVVRASGQAGDIVLVAFPRGIEVAGGYVLRRLARGG